MIEKKIVHITSMHSALDLRIFQKECMTLARDGYQITIIAPHERNERVGDIQLKAIPVPHNRFYRFSTQFWKIYRTAIKENADAYHIHDPELIVIGALLLRKGKKVIYDVHEDYPRAILGRDWVPKYGKKILSSFSELIENWGAQKMSLIIAATAHIRQRFARLGCNTVEINNFPFLNEMFEPVSEVNDDESAVCYLGGIDYQRGIREIIWALEKTEAKLFLAGKFSSRRDREFLIEYPGWSKVVEMGMINRQEVSRVLAASKAGLVLYHPHPNHINAQPTKMFEYMSAGLPVIASDFPLWREIIQKNECGLCCDPLRPEKIAETVQWILDHPREARIMGENGRRAVIEKYNWESEGKRLVKSYEDLFA
jgi:glycosyltransferase involved in cell wall biosynthesis